jgi:hypothetical protein
MHPDDIAGLAQEQIEEMLINKNNNSDKEKETSINKNNNSDNQNNSKTIKLQKEEDKKDKNNKPFDCQLRARSGKVSSPIHKYVTTH